jgi:hypothetical protein
VRRAAAVVALLLATGPVAASPLHAKHGEGAGEGPAVEEDVARALAAAKAKGALVLVDVWAPW